MNERRNMGHRRWGLDHRFPLKDSTGTAVIAERRRAADRRLMNTTLEERLMMYSEMPLFHPRQLKRY